jgi:AmiR/NasT family two-component response regulator
MSSEMRDVGTSPLPTSVRVLVVEDDTIVREILDRQLGSLGHHVVSTVSTGREAMEYANAHQRADDVALDAILLDVRLSDGSGVETAERMSRERSDLAVVLFSGDTLADAPVQSLDDSSVALLPRRPSASALDSAIKLAVHRARELKSARAEIEELKMKLESRKHIERAKGILMRRTGLSEQEAYRILQRTSQDRSVPMVDVAKEVLASEPK